MVEQTTFPTRQGEVELSTGYSSGNIRVISGDGSLYAPGNRVVVRPWETLDGWSEIQLWKDGTLMTTLDMKSHVARRFVVDCERAGIGTEF